MKPPGKTLIAVPYIGEFGWELMNWQGRIRRLAASRTFARVIVCAPRDRRALYAMPERYAGASPGVEFRPVTLLDLPGRPNDDHRVDESGRAIAGEQLRQIAESAAQRAVADLDDNEEKTLFLTPDYRSGLWSTEGRQQIFAELRQDLPIDTDVVLVPRNRSLAPERNLPDEWWQELAARLRNRGLAVEVYAPWFEEAVRQLSRARLAVGASTGGLHLASLCRCPHYVWGSGPEARWTRLGITNRQRYETIWNPLGTPCRYDECGWQPALTYVEQRVLQSLEEIGLVRGRSRRGWSLKPQWRFKRSLARLLESGGVGACVPWRVRELVRHRVV